MQLIKQIKKSIAKQHILLLFLYFLRNDMIREPRHLIYFVNTDRACVPIIAFLIYFIEFIMYIFYQNR